MTTITLPETGRGIGFDDAVPRMGRHGAPR